MNLREFSNGLRVLLCLTQEEFIACINAEDREHFGDQRFIDRWFKNPHRTFVELPTQDQERLFAIIEQRNKAAGLTP